MSMTDQEKKRVKEEFTRVIRANWPKGKPVVSGLFAFNNVEPKNDPDILCTFYSDVKLQGDKPLIGPWLVNNLQSILGGCKSVKAVLIYPQNSGTSEGVEGTIARLKLGDEDSGQKALTNALTKINTFLSDVKQHQSETKNKVQNWNTSHTNEVNKHIQSILAARKQSVANNVADTPTSSSVAISNVSALNRTDADDPRNCIYFGAPGTGKSYEVDKKVSTDDTAIRTTFHPDSDYASFVGAYKPTMKDGKIVYEFVPQAFTKAYVRAWKKMALRKEGDELEKQYLVIEEINRGNCAQIFGDLFQLLDRHDNGFSKYPIDPDTDITNYLATKSELCEVKPADKVIDWINKQLAELTPDQTDATARKSKAVWADILSGSKLVLPPNLYIWATMNTSDQSLFPMDSAFKRRWDWRYSKIKDEGENYRILDGGKDGFDWWQFLTKINSIIRDVTSSPDKQLGYFFVKLPEGQTVIDAETFVNKVVFYLWNDVFKDFDLEEDAFKTGNDDKKRQRTFDDFFKDDGNVEPQKVVEFLSTLLKKDEGQSKPVE